VRKLELLRDEIISCRRCARLVAFRERVAREKRAAYKTENYWGRPVPGFGDPRARIVLVGLAPGAHGANRTGRIFTGDRSGDFLYAALHRQGLASQARAYSPDDGLLLSDVFITCPVRCVPPDNRPSPVEIRTCAPFLTRELASLVRARALVALGAIAWRACLDHLEREGESFSRPRPAFGHGTEVRVGRWSLLGSYHVSQQNTQTGRLTPSMFDEVLRRAVMLANKGLRKSRGAGARASRG
jgi:uracil-DNA glycosylase family 4